MISSVLAVGDGCGYDAVEAGVNMFELIPFFDTTRMKKESCEEPEMRDIRIDVWVFRRQVSDRRGLPLRETRFSRLCTPTASYQPFRNFITCASYLVNGSKAEVSLIDFDEADEDFKLAIDVPILQRRSVTDEESELWAGNFVGHRITYNQVEGPTVDM
ncbi:hypothetical protein GQ600_24879 [Phytophthora cactorum]|nr:hypothetical protein GQ600_24879 [Phytophthora cactorum]